MTTYKYIKQQVYICLEKINSLTLRERLFLCITIIVGITVSIDGVFYRGQLESIQIVNQSIKKKEKMLMAIDAQSKHFAFKVARNPLRVLNKEKETLQKKYLELFDNQLMVDQDVE